MDRLRQSLQTAQPQGTLRRLSDDLSAAARGLAPPDMSPRHPSLDSSPPEGHPPAMVDSYLARMDNVTCSSVAQGNGFLQGQGLGPRGSGGRGSEPWLHQQSPSVEAATGKAVLCSTHSDVVNVVSHHPGACDLRHVRRESEAGGAGSIRAIVGVSGLPGLSLTTWEEFLDNPAVLHPLFQLGSGEVINFDPEEVNVFFQDPRLEQSTIGARAANGRAWRIHVEDYAHLRMVRSWLTERVSVLSVKLISKKFHNSAESEAACLLVVNPACSSIRDRLYSVLSDAMSSFLRHRSFCVEVDLSSCVERWCVDTLRMRCKAEGARLVVTNGDEYQHRAEENNMVCRVACFPFWLVQGALYKVRRRSEYDDHFVSLDGEQLVLCTQSRKLHSYAEQYAAHKKNAPSRTKRVMKWIKKNKKSVTIATQTSTTSLQSAADDNVNGEAMKDEQHDNGDDDEEEDEELKRLEMVINERMNRRRSQEFEDWEQQRKLALKKATASVLTLRGDTSAMGDYSDYTLSQTEYCPDTASPVTVKGLIIPEERPESPVPPPESHHVVAEKAEVVSTATSPSPRLSDDQQGIPCSPRHSGVAPRHAVGPGGEGGGLDNAGFVPDEESNPGIQDGGSDLVRSRGSSSQELSSPRSNSFVVPGGKVAASVVEINLLDSAHISPKSSSVSTALPCDPNSNRPQDATFSEVQREVTTSEKERPLMTLKLQTNAVTSLPEHQRHGSSSSQTSSPSSPPVLGGVLPKTGSLSRSKMPPPPPPPALKELGSPRSSSVPGGPGSSNGAAPLQATGQEVSSPRHRPALAPKPTVTSFRELCQSPPPVDLPPEAKSKALAMRKVLPPVPTPQQEAQDHPPVPLPRSSLLKEGESSLSDHHQCLRSQSIPKARQRSPERRPSQPSRERGVAKGAELRLDTPNVGHRPPERRQRRGAPQLSLHAALPEEQAIESAGLVASQNDLDATPESLKIDLSIFNSESPRRPPPVMPRKLAPPPPPPQKSILRHKAPMVPPGEPMRAFSEQMSPRTQAPPTHPPKGSRFHRQPLVRRPAKDMPGTKGKTASVANAEDVDGAGWRYEHRRERFGRLLNGLLDSSLPPEVDVDLSQAAKGGHSHQRLTAAALSELNRGRTSRQQSRALGPRGKMTSSHNDDDDDDEEVIHAISQANDRSSVMGHRGSSSASPAGSDELLQEAPNGLDPELFVNTARRVLAAGRQTPGGTWQPPELSCADASSFEGNFVRAGAVSRASIRETAEDMLFTPRYKLVDELEEGRNCFSDLEVDDSVEVEGGENEAISDTDTLPTPRVIPVKKTPRTFSMDFVSAPADDNDNENEADLELSDCEDEPPPCEVILPGVKAARLLSAGQRKRRPSRGHYDSRRRYLALNSLRRKSKSMALQSEIRKTVVKDNNAHPMSVTM